ncbi:MAG: carbohydrate ABC transporter substrate-binding protein [Alkalibacterium sp.]
MKSSKLVKYGLASFLSLSLFACGDTTEDPEESATGSEDTTEETTDETSEETSEETSQEEVTLNVAALESGYGEDMWHEIKESYEAANENVQVELTLAANLEEVIRPNMQAGEYPDVVLLAVGRQEALTETLIKENGLENLTDVLDMNVYGEDVTVSEKLMPGFTDTLVTNPYGDGETFLMPMFYSPTGLFYNSALFENNDWELPETWDDMMALGETALEDDTYLFTYPIAGYFDTLLGSMLYASGGPDFFESAMSYEDGAWESEEATQVFETIGDLSDYTHPDTVANANPNDFTQNQQLVLEDKALFMPNGTWIVGEMEEAPRVDDFEWDMMSVPAFESGGDRYAFTFFEQIWVPSQAEDKDAAKEFVTYMYSDEAAEVFASSNAIQPIEGSTELLEGQNEKFYAIYDEEGALPAMGGFASTEPVPGVSIADELYGQIDSVMSGNISVEEWQSSVEEASDQLRPAMQ